MLGRLVLLIAFLVVAVTVISMFRRTPKAQQKKLYWTVGLSALAIALVVLAVTGRIPLIGAAIGALLPFVRRAIPTLIRYFPLLHQWHRNRSRTPPGGAGSNTGNNTGNTTGNRSQVETATLKMTLDHDSNRLSGEVIRGPFRGRALDAMELHQLQDLLDYCHRDDRDSAKLLVTYLNHRFGNRWHQQQSKPQHDGPMDETAAYAVLGLSPGASREDIITAHRRMMQKMHPDRGGSDYLAAQINQAKDILMKKVA